MTSTESKTFERMILDATTHLGANDRASVLNLREESPAGWGASLGEELRPARWTYVKPAKIPQQWGDVIDAIVKQVSFDGWQATAQGEREVKQALLRALLKYKFHTDQELFKQGYSYIRRSY